MPFIASKSLVYQTAALKTKYVTILEKRNETDIALNKVALSIQDFSRSHIQDLNNSTKQKLMSCVPFLKAIFIISRNVLGFLP